MDKRELGQIKKMDKDTLQDYLQFKRHGYYVKNKKGKGSYDRKRHEPEDIYDGYYDEE